MHSDGAKPGAEPAALRDPLIAELRRAYAYHAEALAAPGSCWLGDNGGSSPAHAGTPPTKPLPPGTQLGDFQILDELGRGGMGVVYRARQASLGREVALKVLPGYARHGRTAVRRFKAEAQAAGRLHHSNVVSIHAQGEHEGQYYYAMELIDGISLDAVIRSQPDLLSSTRLSGSSSTGWALGGPEQPGQDSLRHESGDDDAPPPADLPHRTPADYRHLAALLAGVADGLACAHEHGVIHRDVKPHNLLLGTDNRLHLTDFGLARLTAEPHLTMDGDVMGTPAYLSPEQVRGRRGQIDHRTDVYSLGATLYEVITGRKPFKGETRAQVLDAIVNQEPTAPRRMVPRIPRDLETICLRTMEKARGRRHSTAAMLAEDLRRFAAGRPILSRRSGPIEKAGKWVRRHRTAALAWAATAAMLLLAGGWSWSRSASRGREAQRLLAGAYDQLAYVDYNSPELVAKDIERAAALGADPAGLHLVRALVALGSLDQGSAIGHLEAILSDEPENARALYLLAWAQWRDGDRAAALNAFAEAEERGPPTADDAWFFRGLAIHFADPEAAIESYRRAAALRGQRHEFYALAVLHLARARNQQLYATRSLEPVSEAEASLRQLVEHQSYGAYPHYLLSITHRLAAEVYSGSTGTRDDSLVEEHFAQALEWARRGQTIDPNDARPVAAEAECLESMGCYAEAVEARSRAIALADKDRARWEGVHYRWRLHYWLGALDEALDDLVTCSEYDPESRFYAHVYPALLLAEMGHSEEAVAHARAIADEAPGSALDVLWSATCLRLLGRSGEARVLLDERKELVDFQAGLVPPQTERWLRALYLHCCAGDAWAALEALADEVASPWKLRGEAEFHTAAILLSAGDRAGARAALHRSYRAFDGELGHTYHAKLIWIQMCAEPAWPAWIAESPRDTHGARLHAGAGESAVSGYSGRRAER